MEGESYETALIVLQALREIDRVFEVLFPPQRTKDVESFIELLVEVRKELRKRKMWDLADMIRNELDKLGVALLDRSSETEWRFK